MRGVLLLLEVRLIALRLTPYSTGKASPKLICILGFTMTEPFLRGLLSASTLNWICEVD
jgi:hypothetical protein